MNSKERGDLAVGQAISFYISSGFEVCLPIGDKRNYDLVVEKNGELRRIQVKYAGLYNPKGRCYAGLRITGGNQSFHYTKKYGDDDFDKLFILTEKGEKYEIPWNQVRARNELSIEAKKYKKFRI